MPDSFTMSHRGGITDQGIDNGRKVLPDHHIVFQHHAMLERRGQQRLHGLPGATDSNPVPAS
jgi:hypothetical protein